MFNAEQLLGKIMAEMVGSGTNYKKQKKHKGDSMVHSLSTMLLSGKGLMTAIGLGVGAYEILTAKQEPPPPPPVSSMPLTPPAAMACAATSSAAHSVLVLPPLPGGAVNPLKDQVASWRNEDLALRLIQVMIAASHADGRMDSEEEGKILEKLQGQGISQEERRLILTEMDDPKSIEQLVVGISDPRVAQTMYSLAVSAVVVDTAEERVWLDKLATALSISEGMRRFIEAEG
ncbi:MAG: tellurite resistance TerB family protein [Proteobacteria bacterium]|nr:tellurite resistance TerB family protein [Pseudomonadota bacterium]MBU1649754.1 tellurite resistance TerB family protein [Pseudomonadota bacterium]